MNLKAMRKTLKIDKKNRRKIIQVKKKRKKISN